MYYSVPAASSRFKPPWIENVYLKIDICHCNLSHLTHFNFITFTLWLLIWAVYTIYTDLNRFILFLSVWHLQIWMSMDFGICLGFETKPLWVHMAHCYFLVKYSIYSWMLSLENDNDTSQDCLSMSEGLHTDEITTTKLQTVDLLLTYPTNKTGLPVMELLSCIVFHIIARK